MTQAEKKAPDVLNCVTIWLTEAEMESLESHGKVRIQRDVTKRDRSETAITTGICE